MKRNPSFPVLAFIAFCLLAPASLRAREPDRSPPKPPPAGEAIRLPAPRTAGDTSVEAALSSRRSIRSYRNAPLTVAEVSQILWAAQGVTEPKKGLRTAPSARALFLLHVYLVADDVDGLPKGMYRYRPADHALIGVAAGDRKDDLCRAVGQRPVREAPAALVIAGLADKASYSQWMYLEAGHAAQNVYLQAVALDIGTVAMAGFRPDHAKRALSLPENEQPIYVMPLGKRPAAK